MKSGLLLFGLLLSLLGSAQSFTSVDRKAVEKATSDASALTHYPKLLERYNAFDTTLSQEDYRLLYYGFAFQKEYNGYADQKKKEMIEKLNLKNYSKAIEIADGVLQKIPISLIANYMKATALYLMNQEDPQADQYAKRYGQLVKAILSTGDGRTCETAYKALFVTDEYEILYRFYEAKQFLFQSLRFPCDLLRFEPSQSGGPSELYFDISEAFLSMEKAFKNK